MQPIVRALANKLKEMGYEAYLDKSQKFGMFLTHEDFMVQFQRNDQGFCFVGKFRTEDNELGNWIIMKTKGLNFPSEQVLKGIAHKAGFPSHKVINKWSGKHLEPLKFEDFDKPISKFYVTWSEFYHKI